MSAQGQMDFGAAFTALKNGQRIARAGWAASGASLRLVAAAGEQPAQFFHNNGADAGDRDSAIRAVPLADFLASDWVILA